MSGPSAAAGPPSPLLPVLAVAALVLVTASAAVRPTRAGGDGLADWYRDGPDSGPAGGSPAGIDVSALPGPLVRTVQALIAAALIVVIVVLVMRLARAWRDARGRARAHAAGLVRRPQPFGRRQHVDRALADAAAAAAADLDGGDGGDTSDAVVRAWVRIEEAAAGSGAPRAACQTATEFTADLLRRGLADPTPITTLLTSYGQARFGSEPLTTEQVGRARDAFEAVHRRLAAGRAA